MHNSVLPLLLVLKLVEIIARSRLNTVKQEVCSACRRLCSAASLAVKVALPPTYSRGQWQQTGTTEQSPGPPLRTKNESTPTVWYKNDIRVFHFAVSHVQSCSSTDTPYLLKTPLSSSESKQSLQSRLTSTAQVFLVVQWSDIFFLMLTTFIHNFMTVWRTRKKCFIFVLPLRDVEKDLLGNWNRTGCNSGITQKCFLSSLCFLQ